MTKKQLIKQIQKLDQGYDTVSLLRLTKPKLEELLVDVKEKKYLQEAVDKQTRLARQLSDGDAILCGTALLVLVIFCLIVVFGGNV